MKKWFSLIISLAIMLSLTGNAFAAENSGTSNSLSELDAALIAGSILNSDDPANDILTADSAVDDVVPLYNEAGSIVAYYVSFSPTGYAVVNNNNANPAVIEFGLDKNHLIEEAQNISDRIIYNNPTEIYPASQTPQSRTDQLDLYDYFPALNDNNGLAVSHLNTLRQLIPDAVVLSDGDYGFIDWEDMPSGSYTWDMVPNAASTDWATTGEFTAIAQNHCGATAVTNFALYFANRGYSNLKINSSVYDTFVAVHDIVGNGPVMTIADKAKTYFSNRGYTLNTSSVGDFSGIKTAIGNDRPCGILLANGIVDWHWIICVGYRDYSSGGKYMRIVDGWNDTTLKFYMCNSGSLWISASQYWVS